MPFSAISILQLLRDCDTGRFDQFGPSLGVGSHGLKHRRWRTAVDLETH
jgi:hypothetical protein